ncbi:DUF6053 domain-containing protein [Lysobacter yananisis]|uniref:DUF6053 domain-containing protein n=1 Tax=Lysobacter yananisis TaxID=1003114 RepID=UPI003CE59A73
MGGPSGPMHLSRIAATGAKGIGPEGPPTTTRIGPEGPPTATRVGPEAPLMDTRPLPPARRLREPSR